MSGGPWTHATKGVPYEQVSGHAKGALGRDFCERRRLQYSMRFDTAAYGEDACAIMSRAFCHRMQYFFTCELGKENGEEKPFTAEEKAAYEEPSEFTKLASTSTNAALLKRVEQIRGILA